MNKGGNRRQGATDSLADRGPGGCGRRLVAAATVAIAVVPGTLGADGTGLGYDSYRIETGEADWMSLVAGRLTGGVTEDLVVFSGAGETVNIGVYAWDGDTFSRVQLAEVPDDIEDVDLIRLGGQVALVASRLGRVERFDATSGTFEPLVSRPSQADGDGMPEEGEQKGRRVRLVDFARDLNGDGLDDLLDRRGSEVWIQHRNGGFSDPVVMDTVPDLEFRIGLSGLGVADMPATLQAAVAGSIYLRPAIHRLDHDGDGVGDLALAVDGGLAVHRGLATGGWAADSLRVPLEAVALGRLLMLEAEDFVARPQLLAVEDFNGDGVGDVVTVTMSENLRSTRYGFHFGRREGGGTVFREASDTSIAVEGMIALSELSDLDGDGDWDFCAVPVKIGVGTVLSSVLRKSVRVDMNCYRMADSTYPREPSARWRKRIPIDVPSPQVLADLTGDGLLDVVVPAGSTRLDVHPGTGDGDLFAAEPIEVEVDLPPGEGTILFRDLNGDGRADLLVVPQDSGQPVWVALSR